MSEEVDNIPLNRVAWVDVARVVAMVFIILYHFPMSEGFKRVEEVVFHTVWVQFFFFLSGYFGGRKKPCGWLDFKRAGFLFVPYLVWSSLYLVINCIPEMAGAWKAGGLQGWAGFVLTEGFGLGGRPINLSMWYLRDLTLFSLFTPLFLRMPMWAKAGVTGLLVCFPTHLLIPVSLEFYIPSVPGLRCYCLGLFLAPVTMDVARRTLLARPLVILVISAFISLCQYFRPGHYGEVSTWLGMAGLLAAGVFISEHIPRLGRFLASLSPVIFVVYVSHILFLTLLNKILIPLGYEPPPDWFLLTVALPLSFILPWFLCKFLACKAPKLLPAIAGIKK